MKRLLHFLGNLDWRQRIFYLLALIAAIFLAVREVAVGRWLSALPALVLSVAAPIPFRRFLIDHLRVTSVTMNALLVFVSVGGALLPKSVTDESNPWLRLSVMAFIGLYLSTFFLVLSDPDVVQEER